MKTLKPLMVVAFLFLLWPDRTLAFTVIATETARGEYEKGVFSAGPPEFRFRLEIDEEGKRAKLTETWRLRNNAPIATPTDFTIVTIDDGSAFSGFLLRSKERQEEKLLTLIGKPGSLATEVFYLGETFFEYCKASAGRLYLATGKVQRPASVEEDTVRERLEKLEKLEVGPKER